METQTIQKVDKLDLDVISFSPVEVLDNSDDIIHRWRELNRGMTLGNIHKVATKIIFETEEGDLLETSATIWSVTEKYVMLKNSILIPIRCIREVVL